MKFAEGAPPFAAEIHTENDYGAPAERAISQKIADYFASGAWVVSDVNLLDAKVIAGYRIDRPDEPTVYCRGEIADAEPADVGWRFAVDSLFR